MLGVILVVTLIIGKSRLAWPIVTWPMYSYKTQVYPPDTFERDYLRVFMADGQTRRVEIAGFFPEGRASVMEDIIEVAINDADPNGQYKARRSVLWLFSLRMPGQAIASIEVRREMWDVDALANPPVKSVEPVRDILVGTIAGETADGGER